MKPIEVFFWLLILGVVLYATRNILKRWIGRSRSAKLIMGKMAANSIPDEAYFEMAGEELSRGAIRRGLWIKALSEAMGDERKANAIYLRLRVESMKREAVDQFATGETVHTEQTAPKAIIGCPSCHSKLRVDAGKLLDITCPRCSHHFRQQVE